MYKTIYSPIVLLLICLTGALAQDAGREMVGPPPPIELSSLSIVPTASVTRSLDLDLSGVFVFMGKGKKLSRGAALLGMGDIAEVELNTVPIVSSLKNPNHPRSVPGGGLKFAFPVWKYWKGMAVGFRRSATQAEDVGPVTFKEKVGEFYGVASVANFLTPEEGAAASGGWMGTKLKAHVGLTYVAARMTSAAMEMDEAFLRPFGGLEIWRGRSSVPQTRVMAEVGWMTHFKNQQQIEEILVAIGGIRFFVHRYAAFDIGVRYQSNYDGLSESTLQAQMRLGWPTHLVRERILGF